MRAASVMRQRATFNRYGMLTPIYLYKRKALLKFLVDSPTNSNLWGSLM